MSEDGKLHDNPFARVPEKLMHDKNITDGAVRLYAHMVWRYGSNHRNFEGRSKMASFMGVSDTTITNRVRELEAGGWIVTIERDCNPTTGNYTTPFYHIFLSQKQAQKFRESYEPKAGERIRPIPERAERKSRKGKGGKPAHHVNLSSHGYRINSSLRGLVNLSLPRPFNSSWSNLYAMYLDAVYQYTEKILAEQSSAGVSKPSDIPSSKESGEQSQPQAIGEQDPISPIAPAPLSPFEAMKQAIRAAFKWDSPTKNEWGQICGAAKQLVDVEFNPADIPDLYQFCEQESKGHSFTPLLLPSKCSTFKASRKPKVSNPSFKRYEAPDDDREDHSAEIAAMMADLASKMSDKTSSSVLEVAS